METLTLALVLLAAVLVSAIVEQILPKVSSPLVQIGMGALVATAAQGHVSIELEPEIFLVLFIAPLLFNEAREADKAQLWKNRSATLAYAIGLVLVIALAIGFSVHALIPSVGLFAALALGAALGPTDAVAVAALSDEADIPERQQAVLQGESLLNDASGIVAFQFAIAVAVGGSFEASQAVADFLVEFFGGLALGIGIGIVVNLITAKVRDLGLENTTFHVLYQIFTPFIAFLIGEKVGVSAVIAVVACGVTMSFARRNLGPSIAHMNIVSASVWKVLTFTLNGIVFVLLGTQIPNAFFGGFMLPLANVELLGYVVLVTLIMHGARLLWSLAAERIADRRSETKRPFPQRLRGAALTTLAGAKGTITLAIMFTIPTTMVANDVVVRFPNRDLLIFIASGVILLSLVLATFLVPLLAPRKKESEHLDTKREKAEKKADIMRAVIEELSARQTASNRRATSEVIRRYNDRIARVLESGDIEAASDTELRIQALAWEQEHVWNLIERGEIPLIEGYRFASRLEHLEAAIERSNGRLTRFRSRAGRFLLASRTYWHKASRRLPQTERTDSAQIMRDIQARAVKHAIQRMQAEMAKDGTPTEAYSRLIIEYQMALASLSPSSPSITAIANRESSVEEVVRTGLIIELEQIQSAYEEGRLSRSEARGMRQNVMLMQIDLDNQV